MFIGHYAVALAAKKVAPRTSLGTFFIAAQFVDLLWPVLLLLGVEHVRISPGITAVTPLDFYDYPISHSLAGSVAWSLLGGGIYFAFTRNSRAAVVVGLCVASHWVLDFLTHRPDLPLAFGSETKVGLGLWNSTAATLALEFAMYLSAAGLYFYTTAPKDRIGTFGALSLIVILACIHIANIFGPPPPNVTAIAISANALWLFVIWAWRVDKHRQPAV
jgi:hypothetical protein